MTIRPEIFDKAADRIASGSVKFSCYALEYALASKEENDLWRGMHCDGYNWFAKITFGKERNMIREQCLRKVRINMKAQGFYDRLR